MSKINRLINWLKFRKEHEYDEPLPLWMYINGFLSRISIILQMLITIIFIPIIIYEPFSSNVIFSSIYKIGFFGFVIIILSELIDAIFSQWIVAWPRHYTKHILAFFSSLLIITIPLAWWYYYRKKNVVRYFNQFKTTKE